MNNLPYYYCFVSTRLGIVGIVWSQQRHRDVIERIFLPKGRRRTVELSVKQSFPGSCYGCNQDVALICRKLTGYFKGAKVAFTGDNLNLAHLSSFQRKVLLTELNTPYGRVITYGRLATKIRKPGAARAVGNALALNPFPIIIPCHRTVRADGSPGGFQGGVKLKRKLLKLEKVTFTSHGKVTRDHII